MAAYLGLLCCVAAGVAHCRVGGGGTIGGAILILSISLASLFVNSFFYFGKKLHMFILGGLQ